MSVSHVKCYSLVKWKTLLQCYEIRLRKWDDVFKVEKTCLDEERLMSGKLVQMGHLEEKEPSLTSFSPGA